MAAVDRKLRGSKTSPWPFVSWRSGHVRRTVESTLGSETQALPRGAKELERVKALWCETKMNQALEERSADLKKTPGVAAVDCKSAYDGVTALTASSMAD